MSFYLADIAAWELVIGEAVEEEALVLAGELVGGVDLDVALGAESRLVRAAYHRGRSPLADVALYLHPRTQPQTPLLLSLFFFENRERRLQHSETSLVWQESGQEDEDPERRTEGCGGGGGGEEEKGK